MMAVPYGIYREVYGNDGDSASIGGSNSNNGSSGLMHNPGFDLQWTPEEKEILSKGLVQFALYPIVDRYIKIASQLQNKTIRDVVLRCSWIRRKEASKKKKEENTSKKGKEIKNSRKGKEKKEIIPRTPNYLNDPVYEQLEVLHGPSANLIKHNAMLLHQISSNITSLKFDDNFSLFGITRLNILSMMNSFHKEPTMQLMPELPARIQEENLTYVEHAYFIKN